MSISSRGIRVLPPIMGLVVLISPATLRSQSNPYSDALLAQVRAAAGARPEAGPQSLHFLTFAQAPGTRAGALAHGDTSLVIISFAMFQIRFADKWIMVDAGFTRPVWQEFTTPDWPLTYWQDRYDRALAALRRADRIVLTHEHWDHAAGVQRGAQLGDVVERTLLTSAQLHTLVDPPTLKHYVRLDSASAGRYRTVDYDLLYSLAPGVVLIKAPGHTPGAQLIYVRLAAGEELLLVGDLVWLKEGLEWNRQKPLATSQDMKEDRPVIQQQLAWVRRIVRRNGVIAIPSHDTRVLQAMAQRGVLQADLDLPGP